MLYLKKYATESGYMLALCDEELIGKTFSEGKIELDLANYASFYKGDLIDEATAEELINKEGMHSANIVGKRSVAIMLKKGLAEASDVKSVKGVPFVQVFVIR